VHRVLSGMRSSDRNRSLAGSMRAVSVALLLGAVAVLIGMQPAEPDGELWPALFALVPALVSLAWLVVSGNRVAGIAFLLLGALSAYGYTFELLSPTTHRTTNAFALELIKIALIMGVGPSRSVARGIPWSIAGYIAGEVAVRLGAAQVGGTVRFDVTPLVVLLAVVGLRTYVFAITRSTTRAIETLHVAARDEQLSQVRWQTEVKAAALLHDTVLSHLSSMASATTGPVSAPMRLALEGDLQTLESGDWLSTPPPRELDEGDWPDEFWGVVQTARRWGLDVNLTGDPGSIETLDAARATAVALAVQQCLLNVIQHAGVTRAEVVVSGSAAAATVMVNDAGAGFVVSQTNPDRLGLRRSVRDRIESIGGTVQVWSTPGRGTSIVLSVPLLQEDPFPTAMGRVS